MDFPSSPSEGDVYTAGDKTWKYTNGVWLLYPVSNSYLINIDGGVPSSTFAGGLASVDGGGP